jgi:soluble lytic murein transglycosylase-like protein
LRLTRRVAVFLTLLLALAAQSARAEYVVLRSGQRLAVTSYQLLGEKYRLRVNGGVVEVSASDVIAIEPQESFVTAPTAPTVESSTEPFGELIHEAAKRYSVDADLITSVIAAESNFDPMAVSRRNARGLMQLLPVTATQLGVKNVFDPKENIEAGTRYLGDLLHLYRNDLALALAAYNAGPDRVQLYGRRVPPFPETVSYVRRVKRTLEQRKSDARTRTAAAPANQPATSLGAKL